MNHYVPLSLTNRKSSVHLNTLYSHRTAQRTFIPRRDHLVICGQYLLHRTTQHINTNTNIYASSGIRNHDPNNQAAKTYAFDRAATGTGEFVLLPWLIAFQWTGLLIGQYEAMGEECWRQTYALSWWRGRGGGRCLTITHSEEVIRVEGAERMTSRCTWPECHTLHTTAFCLHCDTLLYHNTADKAISLYCSKSCNTDMAITACYPAHYTML
jgi:hypothetical protein